MSDFDEFERQLTENKQGKNRNKHSLLSKSADHKHENDLVSTYWCDEKL